MDEVPPWVADDKARDAAALALREIRGSVRGVRYFGLKQFEQPADPNWAGDGFDSLDFGFEIDLDATTWSLIWEQRGRNEGLLLSPRPLALALAPDADPTVWDVTDRWRANGAGAIESMLPSWGRSSYGPGRNIVTREIVSAATVSDLCLWSLVVRFSSSARFVITLGAADLDGGFAPTADNVAVFFSLQAAAAKGVPLPHESGW
jgi:hypothetical protein